MKLRHLCGNWKPGVLQCKLQYFSILREHDHDIVHSIQTSRRTDTLDRLLPQFTAGVVSCPVSKDPDLDHNGTEDLLDASAIDAAWQSTPASPIWNPDADLNADGQNPHTRRLRLRGL